MIRKIGLVLPAIIFVVICGIIILHFRLPLGPSVLGISLVPLLAVRLTGRALSAIVPDLIFGSIDTGLLAIFAIWGASVYGIAGAIAGGVVGDALTDSIAGFFEGHIAEWLRSRGFSESREAVTTSLGKMAGCLIGSGVVLTVAALLGIQLSFA